MTLIKDTRGLMLSTIEYDNLTDAARPVHSFTKRLLNEPNSNNFWSETSSGQLSYFPYGFPQSIFFAQEVAQFSSKVYFSQQQAYHNNYAGKYAEVLGSVET